MFLVNFVCANFPFPYCPQDGVVERGALDLRTVNLLKLLNKEIQYSELRAEINVRPGKIWTCNNVSTFCNNKSKTYRMNSAVRRRIRTCTIYVLRPKKKWPEDVAKTFNREVDKLERLNPQSPDYNVQLNYLQTMLSLPWQTYTEDNLNLKNAERVLNKDHYGLEKVKERILEHLAVLQLRGDQKSPIICLYGHSGCRQDIFG